MGDRTLQVDARTTSGDASERFESAFETALEELEGMGVDIAVSPPEIAFRGHLPPNLPSLDSEEIGTLLAETKIWAGYISGLLAQSDGERLALQEALKVSEAEVRERFDEDEDMKKYEKDDLVKMDVRVVELRERYLTSEIRYRLLDRSVYPSANDAYEAVSREISRRGMDVAQGVRTGSVMGRKSRQGRRRS